MMIKALIEGKCEHKFTVDRTLPLKGLCAIGIILYHLPSFSDQLPIGLHVKVFLTFIGSCFVSANFIVPLFFFISGYGLMSSYLAKGQNYLSSFFKKRMSKLFLPFIAGIIIFQIFNFIDGKIFDVNLLLSDFVTGGTDRLLPYCWYIFVIFFFYTSFYFVFLKVRTPKTGVNVLWLITIIYVIMIKILDFGVWWYVHTFAFNLGCLWKWKESEIKLFLRNKKYRSITILSLLLITVTGLNFACFVANSLFEYCISLLSIVCPPMVIILLYHVVFKNFSFLNYLGEISYEFYILQGVSIHFLRGNHFFIQSNIIYICCCILCTFVFASIVHKICANILKPSKYSKSE